MAETSDRLVINAQEPWSSSMALTEYSGMFCTGNVVFVINAVYYGTAVTAGPYCWMFQSECRGWSWNASATLIETSWLKALMANNETEQGSEAISAQLHMC